MYSIFNINRSKRIAKAVIQRCSVKEGACNFIKKSDSSAGIFQKILQSF